MTLVLLAAGAGLLPAQESWHKDSSQWFESIEAGGRVRVVNPFGNIYARFGGYEYRVEILATLQWREGAPSRLEVSRIRSGPGLDIVVKRIEVDSSVTTPVHSRSSESAGRIDLVVFVPKGATLDAQTERDRIEIKGLKGDAIASSVTGDIWIRSVEGRVRAKTARGGISAALETGATPEAQDFTTETGDIELYLWEDAAMRVEIATSGEISTDFSMEIEHRRFEEPGKRAVAVIGEGGPGLFLRSQRGRVRLLRLQKDFKPED